MSDPSPGNELVRGSCRKAFIQCGKCKHAFQPERALRKHAEETVRLTWEGKTLPGAGRVKKEDIRDVTRKEGTKEAEEMIITPGRVGK